MINNNHFLCHSELIQYAPHRFLDFLWLVPHTKVGQSVLWWPRGWQRGGREQRSRESSWTSGVVLEASSSREAPGILKKSSYLDFFNWIMKLVNFCFSDCNIFVWEIKGEFLSSVSSTTALSCSDLLSLPEKLQHPRVLSAKRNVTPSLVMTMKMTNRVYGYYVENKSTNSLRIHSLEKYPFW